MALRNQDGTGTHIQELRDRISWLIRLRWLAIAGVACTIWLTPRLLGVRLPEGPLYLLTASLAGYNCLLWGCCRRASVSVGPWSSWFTNFQISADLAFLTGLLHFAGGIENPFICYFVFHIVIASILLSRRAAYLQTLLAFGLLSTMGGLEAARLVPHYHLLGLFVSELARLPIYLFAVLFVIGTMLALTAFIASSIIARLRAREVEVQQLSRSLQERAAETQAAYESVRGLEREKSEYMYRVAHDLRSPLATVGTMLAVVAAGKTGRIPGKAREVLDRAHSRVHSLLGLSGDLLALARARAMRFEKRTEIIGLSELLVDLEGGFRQAAQASEVSLQISTATGLRVRGDSPSLAALLENLVGNAMKYSRPGGRVSIAVRLVGSQMEIVVSDTGIGIPEEEQQKIFDEFYRARNAHGAAEEGTGLGLAIVKAIVEAHQGSVEVESELGVGTTFRVLLPAARGEDCAAVPDSRLSAVGVDSPADPTGPSEAAGRQL